MYTYHNTKAYLLRKPVRDRPRRRCGVYSRHVSVSGGALPHARAEWVVRNVCGGPRTLCGGADRASAEGSLLASLRVLV